MRKNKSAIYNRRSKGMQMNMARQEFQAAGINKKREKDAKRFLKIMKIGAVIIVVLTIIGCFIYGKGAVFDGLILAIFGSVAGMMYITKMDKDLIRGYKKIGVPKEVFLGELNRRNIKPRRLKRINKLWDKTKLKD